MILSRDQRSWALVQNPKAASLSLQVALEAHSLPIPATRRHSLFEPLLGHMRENIGCVVRDPWDRVASGYLYWRRQPRANPLLSFRDFLQGRRVGSVMNCGPAMLDFMRTPQTVWAREATHILRFENLEADFRAFCCDAGIYPIPELPQLNKRHEGFQLKTLYTEEWMVDFVASRFDPDIIQFGYDWPSR